MKKTIKLLKSAKSIALISHTSPDPDTIGSTLGLFAVLKKLGKKVDVYCDSVLNENCNFLEDFKLYKTESVEDFSDYDLVVSVDVPTEEKMGHYLEPFKSHPNSLRIDHHSTSTNFGKENIVVPYSACSILVYEIAKKLKVKLDKNIATCLYFAICGDTSIFRNNNTDSVTFKVCAELFEAGADFRLIYSEFFDKKTVPHLKLTSNTILTADINEEYKYVVMQIPLSDYEKFGASKDEYVGNLPQTYLNCGYKIGAVLKVKDDGIYCSLRSKFEYDVSKIAEVFGGGGHKSASACALGTFDMEVAKQKIKKAIEDYLNSI